MWGNYSEAKQRVKEKEITKERFNDMADVAERPNIYLTGAPHRENGENGKEWSDKYWVSSVQGLF